VHGRGGRQVIDRDSKEIRWKKESNYGTHSYDDSSGIQTPR
jgi:hypothetical protein